MADAADLKSEADEACGFDSRLRHQRKMGQKRPGSSASDRRVREPVGE
jgi:hypothetical protein